MVQHVKRCADSFRLFRCIFTASIVIVGGYGEPWMRHWLVVRRRHWSSLLVRCVVWTRRRRRRRSYITRWWSRVASPRLPPAYCLVPAALHRRTMPPTPRRRPWDVSYTPPLMSKGRFVYTGRGRVAAYVGLTDAALQLCTQYGLI